MLLKSTQFWETLEPKCCTACGEKLEELADCYRSVCDQCTETTFYPIADFKKVNNR
ncbi:YhfH family protein [Paenibacillus filicis]|uniref:YhfH family protein n=1 Tax=Paenibacillus gyeongsangnamensis TaxID=3388067 RepID=A0ABT4QI88_9BACL|nr:protein YhfH [Paenibacillus filicis]MCZ8516597.1 YhfH family protein [Paenibacillus filicis]